MEVDATTTAPPPQTGSEPPQVLCGVDLSQFASVVASSSPSAPFAVAVDTNNLANRVTPTVVAFDGRIRTIGEEAEVRVTQSTITNLCAVVGAPFETIQSIQERFRFIWKYQRRDLGGVDGKTARTGIAIKADFNFKEVEVSPTALLSVFLKRLVKFSTKDLSVGAARVCVALPFSYTTSQIAAVADACEIAGVDARFVSQPMAILAEWCRQNIPQMFTPEFHVAPMMVDEVAGSATPPPGEPAVSNPQLWVFVDVGYAQTSFLVARFTRAEGEGPPTVEGVSVEVLAIESDPLLGTHEMIQVVLESINADIGKKYGNDHMVSVEKNMKKYKRVLHQAVRLVKDLSGLPDSSLELEAFPDDDNDFRMDFSRSKFEQSCSALKDRLLALASKALASAGIARDDVRGLEMVGGGSRIPWVYESVSEWFGGIGVRKTMDGSACASLGATLIAAGYEIKGLQLLTPVEETMRMTPQEKAECEAIETAMAETEAAELLRFEVRNELEAYFLKIESAMSGPYKDFLDKKAIEPVVKETEDWFFESDPITTTTEEYQTKLQNLTKSVHELAPAYFEKLAAKKEEQERALEDGARAAQMMGGEKEDHDTRKMPASQRIALAKKNKDEGNELFKANNVELSITRHVKALTHLSKLYDLSPQEQEESLGLKVACHLNLAQCYSKIGNEAAFKKALASCQSALDLDPKCVKAHYRMAMAKEKLGDIDGAKVDLDNALSNLSDGEDPTEINKAKARVEQLIQKQQAKSKKVYQKMFS